MARVNLKKSKINKKIKKRTMTSYTKQILKNKSVDLLYPYSLPMIHMKLKNKTNLS
ncbi:protein of unknown function [Moritella yayanosii]|uniref:Uncharacterized protein n=1 Tax=Moritella yayanosii TaxID=69539 RepID=A0A330LRI0_9GAMM|nr:protein of unknown function [Moritella yayanosii]